MELDDALAARMRAAVAELVTGGASKVRAAAPSTLIGMLSAAALAPVIVAASPAIAGANSASVLVASVGALGSVGANVLTEVLRDAIGRLRPDDRGAPAFEKVQRTVAERIEAAFRIDDPADREVRGEVIAVFRAADVAGAALQAAAAVEGEDLVPALVGAFTEVTSLFAEFASVLVGMRLSLQGMHRELRQEVARQSVDRERAREAEADIRRLMDLLRDLPQVSVPAITGSAAGADPPPRWDGCPYLGLLPFEERHATVFFGRREATRRLLTRLDEGLSGGGLLLVLGPSGVGKSSLLRAGLVAALADDRLVPGCRSWPRRVLTPTAEPVRQLATHLADLAGIDAIGVHDSLTSHPDKAHLIVEQAVSRHVPTYRTAGDHDERPRLVLIIDQLEELFTLIDNPEQQTIFLSAINAMATPALPEEQAPALVVAGIRGDFLDQAATFTPLRAAIEAGPFTVGPMSEADLKEVITGPAAEAGVQVPASLTQAILDDLRDRNLPVGFDSGVLPLLSQVLFVMWEYDPAHRLTVENYRRTGGIATIVHASAERVHTALSDEERSVARRVFVHLAIAADGRLTRRPAARTALRSAAGCDDGVLDSVLEAFTTQRLITRSHHDVVDLAHEEILQSWYRLRDWLQSSITDQALHRALIDDVQAWQEHQRDPSYLYRGGQLLAVQDAAGRWADEHDHFVVDEVAAEFLAASRHRDRRRRRITRTIATTMALLLLVAGGAAIVAARSAILAGQNAARADQQHALALSRQLAAQSRAIPPYQRATSQRLAATALHIAGTDEAADQAGNLLAGYRSVLPQTGNVLAVAFSRDGKLLAAGGETLRLWDPATAKPVGAPLTGHTGLVRAVAFSPDGKLLATAGDDATLRLWDASTGKPTGELLTGHSGEVSGVAFSPDGKLLATTGDATVRLWNPATSEPVGTPMTGHTDLVTAVAFSPDGKLLATTGDDATVRLWNPATGKPARAPLTGHTGPLSAVGFSPGGRLLATGGDTVRLWHPASGEPVGAPLTGHTGSVSGVAFSPDGKLLATTVSDEDGGATVRLWDPVADKPVGAPLTGHAGLVWAAAFSPDGRLLATAGEDGTVRLWNPATGKPVGAPLTGHTGLVPAVALNPDGQLATGADTTVRLWDSTTGKPARAPLTGHTGLVSALGYSPDGKLLATADDDSTVRVRLWDPTTGKPVGAPLTGHTGSVLAVAFSPDGKLLATASGDASARLWDTTTSKPVGVPLTGHTGQVWAVAFSPDGNLLATANDGDASVRLWNPATGKPVGAPLTGHTDLVSGVAFSPDGNLLATTSHDASVRLWNPATGKPVGAPLTGHTGPVSAVTFSPQARLATGGLDATVRLWDIATGKPVGAPLTGHTGPVRAVAFSADARLLATASDDKTVRLWEPALYVDPARNLCDQTGDLTPDEWNIYAEGEPYQSRCR